MKTGFLRYRRAFRESGRTDLPVETQALLEKVTNARAEYFSDRTMRPVDSISGVRIREQSLVVSVTIPIANALPTQTEANAAKELSTDCEPRWTTATWQPCRSPTIPTVKFSPPSEPRAIGVVARKIRT